MNVILTIPNDLILIISDYVHFEDNIWENGVKCVNDNELELAINLHLWIFYQKGMNTWINFKKIKRLITGTKSVIHNNITHLKLTYEFNDDVNDLPDSVKYLYIQNCDNTSEIKSLPPNLRTLRLSDDYNLPILQYPKTLKRFIGGEDFDQNIDNLPDSVEYIFLGESYNTNIKKLPNNLITMTGTWFALPCPPGHIFGTEIKRPERYTIHCKFPESFKVFDLEEPYPTITHITPLITETIKIEK